MYHNHPFFKLNIWRHGFGEAGAAAGLEGGRRKGGEGGGEGGRHRRAYSRQRRPCLPFCSDMCSYLSNLGRKNGRRWPNLFGIYINNNAYT